MNRLLLSAVLAALAAAPSFAQLAPADKTLITECTDNVDPAKKGLSPERADSCVKALNDGQPPLIARYSQEDPEAADILIARNNALLDLKRIVVKQEWYHGATALSRVMEKPDCTLCDMGLGPKPETAFDWIGKYASDRLEKTKVTVRTWDVLGPIRTGSLASPDYGMDKASWNEQGMLERYSELSKWARKETDKLVAISADPAAASKLKIDDLVKVLREDLIFSSDAPYRAKLDALSKTVKESAGKPVAPTTADKKGKDLSTASDRLAALSPDNHGEYLAQTFDNAGAARPGAFPEGSGKPAAGTGGGAGVKPITPVKMTADQEKALGEAMIRMDKDGKPTGYLVDVMNETEAGKRTVAFYGDPKYAKAGSNKLNFGFQREEGVFGFWSPANKNIVVNSEVAEEFAAKRGMTVEQLMKDKDGMRDLALYISPTFVHESEHQNQTARAIDAGIDYVKFSNGNSTDPYTRAKENLSNKWSAEHMIEYCSKHGGAGCFQNFHEMHADNADKFMQGGMEALDTLKAPLYPRIDSLEGGAAREFKQAQSYAAYLKTLEDKNRTSPASMTAQEKKDMADYRELMNTRFKWYTMMYRESVDNEAEALAFRKKYGGAGLGLSVPAL
ncbi:MAG: hypothetical protein M0025_12215 [Elusimicrobia bacterium]|nr:hypothetical protein [Elusimicrobiota bacterium]